MPRHARTLASTQTYHVVIKGADRQLLFEETNDYKKYLEMLEFYKEKLEFELFAYCLMSNHVHLLIRTTSASLETIFRCLNTCYAGWFNAKYDRTGHLQDDRFFSEPIESLQSLKNVARYIHYNPTKAGLEKWPGACYPWSSFNDYLQGYSRLLDIDIFHQLTGEINDFLNFHKVLPAEDCLDIHTVRKRLPDDVAKELISTCTGCKTSTDFQKLTIVNRNKQLQLLHDKGLSIRQLNRLTGTPRGVIERILVKK